MGKRAIVVGQIAEAFRHNSWRADFADCRQDARVGDGAPGPPQLFLNHVHATSFAS